VGALIIAGVCGVCWWYLLLLYI